MGTTNFDTVAATNFQGNLLVGGTQLPIQVLSADGAITIKSGIVVITKSSTAAAITLAAPIAGAQSAGGDDGKILYVDSTTAKAHTLTIAGGLRGAGLSADVGTFGGAVGDGCSVYAYNGAWYPLRSVNVTFA